MKNNFYLISFLLLTLIPNVVGQNKTAYGSDKGIYILNTLHPANRQTPYKSGISYVIERSLEGKTEYTVVAKYATPVTVDEFVEKANKSRKQLPYNTEIDQAELLLAWKKYDKTKSWDSLKNHLSYNYVAAGFGILMLDSTARKDVKYSYRISLLDAAGKPVETMNSNTVSFPEKMTYVKPKFYKQTTDGISSTLIWKSVDTRIPHHFKIYRSSIEKGGFEAYAISKVIHQSKDSIFYSFTDNDMNKGTMYRYYISPSNSYGNYNLFSDTLMGTNLLAKDANLPTNLFALAIDSLDAIKLSWKIEHPYELDAIELYKGIDYDKPFDKLVSLSPNDSIFMDRGVAPGQRYFYTLKVIDRLGRASITTNRVFGICNGITKPLPVIKVIAKATEQGVKIQWLPNGENIRGFYIYRCEGIDGEFVQLGDFIPYQKQDSLPAYLDKDENMVLGSTYSYTIRQENDGHILGDEGKPAFVQPVHARSKVQMPMVTIDASTIDKGILLSWINKNSVNGVYGINILRQKAGESTFAKINAHTIDFAVQNFVDSTFEKNTNYVYKLSFVNSKGEELAFSNSVDSKVDDYALAAPYNLRGVVENNQVKLTWESTSKNASEFKIYKRTAGKQPEEIGRVKNTVFAFTDPKLNLEEVTLYYITSVNKVTESKESNEWQMVIAE